MDGLHGAWSASTGAVWDLSAPLRRVARAYTRAIGLEQRWNMFSEPPDSDQYALMRYYIQTRSSVSGVRVDRALVFPARREDRFRWFNAGYYEEKAVRNARQAFMRRLAEGPEARRVSDLPLDLLPVVRYYAGRYRGQLADGETITRAEIWAGSAPVPPPDGVESAQAVARLKALRDYYEDSQPVWIRQGSFQPVGSTAREADVTWTLLYFEEWR
jgi:hypothetical protein